MTKCSTHKCVIKSPTGNIKITETDGFLNEVTWTNEHATNEDNLNEASLQLQDYFSGKLTKFDVPIKFKTGTVFQQKVWNELLTIPYGETVTYGDIAKKLNSGARAVGTAVGKNPIPIIAPCHRVVGSNGHLGGFSGGEGIPTKKQLLKLEDNNKD